MEGRGGGGGGVRDVPRLTTSYNYFQPIIVFKRTLACDQAPDRRLREFLNLITKCDNLQLQSATAYIFTKCENLLLQSATAILLQSATSVITKCDRYYKV